MNFVGRIIFNIIQWKIFFRFYSQSVDYDKRSLFILMTLTSKHVHNREGLKQSHILKLSLVSVDDSVYMKKFCNFQCVNLRTSTTHSSSDISNIIYKF